MIESEDILIEAEKISESCRRDILNALLRILQVLDTEYLRIKKFNTKESRAMEQEIACIRDDIENAYDNLRFL